MFEVMVERLVYVKGLPAEMIMEALEAGELRKDSVVGLEVSSPGEGGKVLVDVRLAEEGQTELFKPGLTIPLEEGSGTLSISACWQTYLPQEVNPPEGELDFGGSRRRPNPGAL
jgi:hypothetical protein